MAERGAPRHPHHRSVVGSPTPGGFLARNAKGRIEMKAFVMIAAVLTSALLTFPTVSQAADTKVVELRLNA